MRMNTITTSTVKMSEEAQFKAEEQERKRKEEEEQRGTIEIKGGRPLTDDERDDLYMNMGYANVGQSKSNK